MVGTIGICKYAYMSVCAKWGRKKRSCGHSPRFHCIQLLDWTDGGLKYDGKLYGEIAKHGSYHLVSSFCSNQAANFRSLCLRFFPLIPFSPPFPVWASLPPSIPFKSIPIYSILFLAVTMVAREKTRVIKLSLLL